ARASVAGRGAGAGVELRREGCKMRTDRGGHEGPRRRRLSSDKRYAMQERTTTTATAVETAKPSAPEAVRRAIAALGYRAEVSEILDYVREHFGIGGAGPRGGQG